MGFGILLSVLPLVVVIGVIVLIIRAVRRREGDATGSGDTHGIRRFFQYLLLFGLIVVAAIGTSNLLARLFGSTTRNPAPTDPFRGGPDPTLLLAQDLAFTAVGIPLAALIAWWTWRTHRSDPDEARSGTYGLYVTVAALTAALVGLGALASLIGDALTGNFDADSAGRALVWGALWMLHWELARRTLPASHRVPHLVLGAMIGLVTMTAGFVSVLGTTLDMLLRPGAVLGVTDVLADSAGLLVAGTLVWVRYWLTAVVRLPRTTLWLVHVLVLGVGGGLVLTLVGASFLLWDVLVWFLGDPVAATAVQHFNDATGEFALVVGGVLVWWYHRTVLTHAGVRGRSEVQRVYEYLVAGIGLLASATGVGTLIVAVVESLTPGIDRGMTVQNTLLGAITLLVVGVPVWLAFWLPIRRKVAADPPAETGSRTRRIYLVLLFGLSGVAAAIALIVAAVILLQGVIDQQVGGATLRSMRYALGVLVAAAALSFYHGTVWREDRRIAPARRETGPRSVVLIGPADPDLAREIARQTGARVQAWGRAGASPWSRDDLLVALAGHPGRDLVALSEQGGVRVLEVDRG